MSSISNIVPAGQTAGVVIDFQPPKIERGVTQRAVEYLDRKAKGITDFRMSDPIRMQTGIAEIENQNIDKIIEERVLQKLKDVQEAAYQEAYQLGHEDGRKEAFTAAKREIDTYLESFGQLLESLTNLKKELTDFNESHLVQLTFHIAKRLTLVESKIDPSIISEVIKKAIEMAQLDENIRVQVSPAQLSFLEDLQKQHGRDFEFLKKIKLDPVEGISEGGCIIETNYGEIDAQIEQRIDKLWTAISESLVRVKDRISAA